MVRSIITAYLWLAALWSVGAVLHEVTGLPEAVGLLAGLVAAAWFMRPVSSRVLLQVRASRRPPARRGPAEPVLPTESSIL